MTVLIYQNAGAQKERENLVNRNPSEINTVHNMRNTIYLTFFTVLTLAVVKVAAEFKCDFENNCTHWAFSKQWKLGKSNQWPRPETDHTNGKGDYLIARPLRKGDVAIIIGQTLFYPADNSCLIFSTYFEGDVTLRIYAENVLFGSRLLITIALADGKKMDKWETVKLPMNGLTSLQKIKITVTFANWEGFFAIDDLSFSETTCNKSNEPDDNKVLDILEHVFDHFFGREKTSASQVKSTTKTLPLRTTSTIKPKTTIEDRIVIKLKSTEAPAAKNGTVNNIPVVVTTENTAIKEELTIETKKSTNIEDATEDNVTPDKVLPTEKIITNKDVTTEKVHAAIASTTKVEESSIETSDRQSSSTSTNSVYLTANPASAYSTARHRQTTHKNVVHKRKSNIVADDKSGSKHNPRFMIISIILLVMIIFTVLSLFFYKTCSKNSMKINFDMKSSDSYSFNNSDKQKLATADQLSNAHV